MDPNEALARLRELLGSDTTDVAVVWEALDGWLTRGGFMPDAWAHGRATTYTLTVDDNTRLHAAEHHRDENAVGVLTLIRSRYACGMTARDLADLLDGSPVTAGALTFTARPTGTTS